MDLPKSGVLFRDPVDQRQKLRFALRGEGRMTVLAFSRISPFATGSKE